MIDISNENLDNLFSKLRDKLNIEIDERYDKELMNIICDPHLEGPSNVDYFQFIELLKKRGYSNSGLIGKESRQTVWYHGFVAVDAFADENGNLKKLHIWHDIPNSQVNVVEKAFFTHIPVLLPYMERGFKRDNKC